MKPWYKRRSSMRGRLALLLMVVVVSPMVGVGLLVWQSGISPELDADDHARIDQVDALPLLRVSRALAAVEHALADDLRDLALRTAGMAAPDPADRAEAAFGDPPGPARSTRVLVLGPPQAEADAEQALVRRALGELPGDGTSLTGYVVLPAVARDEAGAGGPPRTLHQFAAVPQPDGRTLVALRPVDPDLLFGPERADASTEGALVLLDGEGNPPPGPPPAGFPPERVERAAREAVATDAFQEADPDGAVAALAVRGPDGRPLALVMVRHEGLAAHPLLRRHTALLSSVLGLLGLMCGVGVLAAMLMGALAPRLVWRDIRRSTDFIFGSVDRLRELVRRNQGALDEQSRLTRGLLESVARLEAASRDILRTANDLAKKAEQSAWVSQSGNQKAELAQRSVIEVRERVMDLSCQMEELGRRCEEIGSLTSFINRLSTETNTLSINATLQAARSGGHGRQFTVMAEEIQRLADLSQDSTRDINHLVERIQQASRATLGSSKEGCDKVDRATTCCEELEAAFARILRWVEETTQSARGIELSTEEQAGSLKDVSQSIEQLEQHSRYTTHNYQDIVLAADELAQLGDQMNETWKVG